MNHPPRQFRTLPQDLQDGYRDQWEAYHQAALKAGLDLPDSLAQDEQVAWVWALSDFVYRACVRNPAILPALGSGGELSHPYPASYYLQRLADEMMDVTDAAGLAQRLRRFRTREMVRIAWRDLTGAADLAETMRDLSRLAEACLDIALQHLHTWLVDRYGQPLSRQGEPQALVVIGMGKLGGNELNFSSDIDLIFAYPEPGETQGGSRSITNDEFFSRLGRHLINALGATTPEGIVFRVDMRLRPNGDGGPLVMNFDTMEHYYQFQGREWERYAWIKARVVAGDQKAGQRLLNMLKPFVYRRYLDYGAFESLREMKQKISLEVQRKGLQHNVKLGPGGIREVEFFGQIFQLIRGGVTPDLQIPGIQKVLTLLVKHHYIPSEICHDLNQAYTFLRQSEHRLQMFNDQQTHKLPDHPPHQVRLALSMGFEHWESYRRALDQHMGLVHEHFEQLLQTDKSDHRSETGDHAATDWSDLWLEGHDAEHHRRSLATAGYKNPDRVLQLLHDLRAHPETRALSREGRDRLDRLVPIVIHASTQAEQPTVALERILELIKTIQRRTNYLALLLENRAAFKHLIKLCNASPWIASFLARHPVLLDELLDPRTLYTPSTKPTLQSELRQRMAVVPPDDFEQQIEQLCIFKQSNMLRVAAADITDVLPLMKVSDFLSAIAESVVEIAVELAWHYLAHKHGRPLSRLNQRACARGFAVLAYGKLGGLELGYASDLDLVFVHAGEAGQTKAGPHPIDNAYFFTRLGQRVVHTLTTHTAAGVLYETDMRLRPSGSSGVLVTHYRSFREYQLNDAWTWEHQALLRARPIVGDALLTEWFDTTRHEILTRPRQREELRQKVLDMRERLRQTQPPRTSQQFDLKQDPGGIVDIEFLVQFLVLAHAHELPKLVRWTDNVRLLQGLAESGVLADHTAHFLRRAYLIYRAAAHRINLQQSASHVAPDRFSDLRRKVTDIWQFYLGPLS